MSQYLNFNPNQTALITGASSGIGYAAAVRLAEAGCHQLVLLARRADRLLNLKLYLESQYKNINVEIITADLGQPDHLKEKLKEKLEEKFLNRKIDILINNAGLALTSDPIQTGVLSNWDRMIEINLKAVLFLTQWVLNHSMLGQNSGHIINLGSVAGRDNYPGGNVYCMTKHALRSFSQNLRLDLLGKNIRVTEVAPGAVHTEFSEVRWGDKEKSDAFYRTFTPLKAEDVAEAIFYALACPQHVNISELVIYPTDQASVNYIYKK